MKNIQIIALAILFAVSGIELIQAKGCPAGQRKNAQGKCVKASRVVAANKAKKAVDKVSKSTKMASATATMNAIEAYNTAINDTPQNPTKIAATQTAAINAINTSISTYQGYLPIIAAGLSPVVYGSTAHAIPAPGMSTGSGTPPVVTTTSTCNDGTTAICDDGSAINTLPCYDGSTPDSNGMCADGSLVTCNDGYSSPTCNNGTSPMAPSAS